MRVVIDTNVYISAAVFGGIPLQVIRHMERGDFEPYASPAIQGEVERVLKEKMGWAPGKVAEAFAPIWALANLIDPPRTIRASRDETDDRILECAVVSGAELIVSGDEDLLILREFQGIPILTPRKFVELLSG